MDVDTSLKTDIRPMMARVGVVAALVVAGLVWLATLRFPVTLVDPPQPTPDYAVQAGWSLAGAALVAVIALATTAVAWRWPERPSRAATIGVVAMLICGIGSAVIAIIASTP